MKPGFQKGLAAPAGVALATLIVWGAAGPTWALLVLAVGAGAIIASHLAHQRMVWAWAKGPREADVPAGRGSWADVFSAIHRRVRMRKAYQRDLRQLIERFRQAAEAIPDGVVLLDAHDHIAWANARAQKMLGLSIPSDRGRPIVNLVRQPDFVRFMEAAEFVEPVVIEQTREPRLLSMHIVPFAEREKMLLARDVTQLEAIARMRRDFIANVSHELKTPLTVVSGFIETLEDVAFEPRQRARYLGLMKVQARNMQRLVDDLLTLSGLESEHNPLNDELFAVVPLLLELSADAKGLSLGQHEVALDIGEAASVVGNRNELASAWGNLVSNAVRYTPPGGTITLRWEVYEDGRGRFCVIDTGIGIAPEHMPRLTERFYRVDRSRSRATGGTGLGLAIVKHVLLRHQAELEIHSEPGRGSSFAVLLPARRVRRAPSTTLEGPTSAAEPAASPDAGAT